MSSSSVSFPLIVFAVAYFTAYIVNKRYKVYSGTNRLQTIDAFRGFLALFVFIHHTSVWRNYLNSNEWEAPNSGLYRHFGETSVTYFFLITSFLFTNKIFSLNGKKMDFGKFFIGRIFRLAPLYVFSVLIVFLIVLYKSEFVFLEPIRNIILELGGWLTFAIYGKPDINTFKNTSIIIAGVIWSLRYEWYFYFALPVLYVLITGKIIKWYVVIPLLLMVIINMVRPSNYESFHFISFIGGIVPAYLLNRKNNVLTINIKSYFVSLLTFMSIIALLFFDGSKNSYSALILISFSFTMIALGNNLFGLLNDNTLKFMGDICYSTYLLHGLLLFIVFDLVIGQEAVKQLTELNYCLLVVSITPLLVLISYFSFKYIESPFIRIGKKI